MDAVLCESGKFINAIVLVATEADALELYAAVLKLTKTGQSKHASLKKLNKDLKSFQRIQSIYMLKITKPHTYNKVRITVFHR